MLSLCARVLDHLLQHGCPTMGHIVEYNQASLSSKHLPKTLQLEVGFVSYSLANAGVLAALISYRYRACSQKVLWFPECNVLVMYRIYSFAETSPNSHLQYFCFFFWGVLWALRKGVGMMQISQLELNTLLSPDESLCINCHLIHEDTSLMRGKRCIYLWAEGWDFGKWFYTMHL